MNLPIRPWFFALAAASLTLLPAIRVSPQPVLAGGFVLEGQLFRVPEGFQIQRIAGPGLVDRPVSADFDERGRLYVTDSSGTNDKIDQQLANPSHRIVRLVDDDQDGVFDRSTLFADRVMFPEGAMWYRGSLYVAAPPSIWKFTDSDDDGVADQREEWHLGETLTGCANDLHGPFLGPDGWIYWCKGAWAEQNYQRPGREPLTTRAAHIFRKRLDGSGIEVVMTGGMDNPVDVAFTPTGERIFTTTFLQHPAGGRRDGLLHAVYGGVYGKVHPPIETAPRTGDVMPVLAHLGAAAPAGLTRYDSTVFGSEYRDNLFACLFNMHKVTRHELIPRGATFETRDSDFLTSDSLDFHPTDVLEDADGSLIVVDTGGWYKLCCPTSQLWKPDVLGAIYRIRKTDAPPIDDPRGQRIKFDQLRSGAARFLADRRPFVRRQATQAVVDAGFDSFGPLSELLHNGTPRARIRAVQALSQINHAEARGAIRRSLADPDSGVRQAAGHAVSVNRDPEALAELLVLLESPVAADRRIAAEALGRLDDGRGVLPLLDALKTAGDDRFLEHSIVYALIELDAPILILSVLHTDPDWTRTDPRVLRGALLALDQMPGGKLEPELAERMLESADPLLRETGVWIAGRRPEWGGRLAERLKQRLTAADLGETSEENRQGLLELLARMARSVEVRQVLGDAVAGEGLSPAGMSIALRAMARANLPELPAEWGTGLARVLRQGSAEGRLEALQAIRSMPAPKAGLPALAQAAIDLARESTAESSLRRLALAAAPGGPGELDDPLFELVVEPLRGAPENVSERLTAVEIAAKAKFSPPQLVQLARLMTTVGPLEADRLLAVFRDQTDAEVGRELVAAVDQSASLSSLRIDALQGALAKFPEEVRLAAQPVYDRLNAEAGKQKEKLAAVQERLKTKTGDVRRGQAVFHQAKSACVVCHAMGYLGGVVGPDLTRIGGVRSEQDLLESILFPSLTFVANYEPVVILTKAGKTFGGNVRSEGPEEVVLTTGPREEVRIARDEIEEIRPGTVSVMPSGLDQQLSDQDLADLLAFLKGAK